MTVVEDDPVQRWFRSAAAATAGPSPETRRYLDAARGDEADSVRPRSPPGRAWFDPSV